jgi:hypothetical protein
MTPDYDLDNRFDYHRPDAVAQERHQRARGTIKSTAEYLVTFLPEGREKSLALTKLEEAMFWANAAIARNAP